MRSHKRRRMFAELRPNSHILPSRTEPNIRPNSSAELRRLPNFGPSLIDIWCMSSDRTLNSETATVHWCMFDDNGETSSRKCSGVKEFLSGLTCMKWAAGYQVPLVRLWVVTNPLSLFPFSILVVSFLIPTDFECLLHVSIFNLISRVLCQDTVGIFCAPFTHNWMVWAKQGCHLHWGICWTALFMLAPLSVTDHMQLLSIQWPAVDDVIQLGWNEVRCMAARCRLQPVGCHSNKGLLVYGRPHICCYSVRRCHSDIWHVRYFLWDRCKDLGPDFKKKS